MLGMYTHMDFYENSHEVFHGMKTSMDNLKIRIEERKRALPTQEEILSYKMALEEEALNWARPRLEDQCGGGGGAGEMPVSAVSGSFLGAGCGGRGGVAVGGSLVGPSALALPAAVMGSQQQTEIEGYLFKRNDKKVWVRRYFIIKNGKMFYANTYPTGKLRGVVLSTDSLNLRDYNIRLDTVEDRRFCFEVYGRKQIFKLQAESARDLADWMNVFEAAKLAYQQPFVPVSLMHPPESRQSAGNSPQPPPPTSMFPTITPQSLMNRPYVFSDGDQDGEVATSESRGPRLQKMDADGDDENESSEEDAEIEVEEVGGDVSGAEVGKPAGPFEDVTVTYPDKAFEAKNKELHKLLRSVPPSDFVMDAFAIFLQRANLIQGKIFVTQNRICFYSNIMGIISVLVIHLKEITNITRSKNGLYKCINIETTKAPHQFKTFMKDDGKTHAFLVGAWENSRRTTGRLNAQELFEKLSASLSRLDEKEDDKLVAANETIGDDASIGDVDGAASGDGARNTDFDLPEGIPIPAALPACECTDHLEHKDIEITVQIPAKRAFDLLYGTSPESKTFWNKFFAARGEKDVVSEAWVEPATGVILGEAPPGAMASKVLNYTMPVNAPMVKVKEAGVESISYLTKKVEHFVYVIEKRSTTPALPYADSFVPIVKTCITWTGKSNCKIAIFTGIKFYKSPMVKGIIRQQALSGSELFSKDLGKAIQAEVHRIMAKENPKKAGAAGEAEPAADVAGPALESSSTAGGANAESILPFGLSQSRTFQWGVIGLLTLSLLLNITSAFRGGRRVLPQQVVAVSEVSRIILGYLGSHYPEWNPENCNSSTISPYRASALHNSHFPRPVYHQDRMKSIYVRLHSIHKSASEARDEALESLRWLDELERDVFWAGYWNWVADGVVVDEVTKHCREVSGGVSQYVGGCENIRGVLSELEKRTF
ncbi:hypothetical protein HDU98_012049 [Podochytrium sp. JEL0797]|nr:hypothetical protein HDU98_012049 [Podochytrium sp. JEL0797]